MSQLLIQKKKCIYIETKAIKVCITWIEKYFFYLHFELFLKRLLRNFTVIYIKCEKKLNDISTQIY